MRSLMYVPGHRQRMIDKALGLTCDVALLDLEDGVPLAEKEVARQLVAEALGRPAIGPARYVRVNQPSSDRIGADLRAVVRLGCAGLLIAKVDRPDEVREIERAVSHREQEADLARGTVRFIAAIESARGLLNAPAIAESSERMAGLMFGAEDFARDIGLTTTRVAEASELIHARSAIVVAAAAAHVGSFDGVWPDIKDAEGLRRDSLQARRLGFTGKSLIHPGQIETINEIFSPTEEDVDYARRVVAAFEEAEARGEGAISFGGQIIDRPIVERARRVLAEHAALVEAVP